MVTKEWFTKIVNFMTRGVVVFVLGRWGYKKGGGGKSLYNVDDEY